MTNITSVSEALSGFEREISDAEYPRIAVLIGRAERKIQAELGDLVAWSHNDPVLLAGIRDVVGEVLQTVLRAPGVYRSENSAMYGYSVDTTVATLALRVTPDQIAFLTGLAGGVDQDSGPAYRSVTTTIPGYSPQGVFGTDRRLGAWW